MSRPEPMAPSRADTDHYRYRLEFLDDQGTQVLERPLSAEDFSRAVIDTYFELFRTGVVDTYAPDLEAARWEPRFLDQGERSLQCGGFRIIVPLPDGGLYSRDFPLGYFHSLASLTRASWRRSKDDANTGSLTFRLGAYLEDEQRTTNGPGQLQFDLPEFHVPIRRSSLHEFGTGQPWDNPDDAELPVLLDRSLIEDACDEAARCPDREIGGLLLGHVCQDSATGHAFLSVTCLVSMEGTTEATATSVTFSPASFARAQEMIRLRARGDEPPEILVGWFHSHPFRFCSECPLPVPPECIRKVLFFSEDDVQLMETTFPHPYMVGLLAGVEPRLETALGHLPVRLFGWRRGEISPVGFQVMDR